MKFRLAVVGFRSNFAGFRLQKRKDDKEEEE
jgi:hypothetical protein